MNYINAFHVLVGIIVLLLFWHFCWKRYAMEKFRQDVFAIRNRLFELALDDHSGFSFDDPTYNKLWDQLNGLIHFSYLMSADFLIINRILLKYKFNGQSGNDVLSQTARINFDGIQSEEARAEAYRLHRYLGLAIFRYMTTTSPVFVGFFAVLLLKAIGRGVHSLALGTIKKVAEAEVRPALEYIQRQAVEVSRMEQARMAT